MLNREPPRMRLGLLYIHLTTSVAFNLRERQKMLRCDVQAIWNVGGDGKCQFGRQTGSSQVSRFAGGP